ncbi:hypothetical protein J3R30DRAFT_3447196 [Lentinula aciculospora]|uniref:GRF-type domain-containing protein n=1 Tax=Lentinula aciculospora TaxID=153920 RepID=A0A9W9AI04_9AGAR|nr:hypothetical protein J3R30DRAFT_3447196 [Lentinula aciculospora]
MSVNKLIHVSPVDSSGIVRCYTHELEASQNISQTEGNSNREFYCCSKNPEDRCDFFFWVDQLTARTPHQLPVMSQNTSSETIQTPSRTSQVPRTPSKLRMDAIQEALAQKKSDPRVNGNNQISTPPSFRPKNVKTPGQLERDETIRRALETPSQSQQQCEDANVFQSSQPPASKYKLTPLSQESINNSDEDDSFAALPLTPPTTQRYKRSRDQDLDEDSEPDFRSTPSKNKGKKKANPDVAHDPITPTTSTKDVTDVLSTRPSLKFASIMKSLEEFEGQVVKLERQMKALKRGNEAKLEKIHELEADNHAMKLDNDKLREKIRQLENH